eukprot:jgi/Tetstr1/448561/TSEL_003778.t1
MHRVRCGRYLRGALRPQLPAPLIKHFCHARSLPSDLNNTTSIQVANASASPRLDLAMHFSVGGSSPPTAKRMAAYN